MTVSSQSNKISYEGNGSATSFSFTFPGVDEDDIEVYITDSDGDITELDPSLYTVTLNAATPPNPTGAGGSVEYPLTGSPLAAGNTLTILRTLELTQPTSLANQGTSFQSVFEQALDNQLMMIQQLDERLDRQIIVAVSDDDPEPLPPAAQRASMLMGFDADGNPIAVELTDAGEVLVSSAMIPVVEAATLALARGELGLGDIAVEDIGAGLEDDGSGSVRTINVPTNDAIGQSVTAAFHTDERHATAAITYTNPAASTLFDGFSYIVHALGGDVTFAIDAGDAFSGMSNGVSLIIPKGTATVISTDGVLTWFARPIDLWGPAQPLNLSITASVAASNLTIAIKDRNGNDPSASSPVILPFRNATITSGMPSYIALTSALSIVVPNGASLGTANAIPFRVWVEAFNNAGTAVLGVFVSVVGGATPTRIANLDDTALTTGTAISAGSTSAATHYTASGVTTRSFVILGYIDFNSGQVTAGVWASAPSKIQLYGPNIPKPGQQVQVSLGTTASATSVTAANTQTNLSASITLSSPMNLVHATASYSVAMAGGGASNVSGRLSRGGTPTYFGSTIGMAGNAGDTFPSYNEGFDARGSVAATDYFLFGSLVSGIGGSFNSNGNSLLTLRELMV